MEEKGNPHEKTQQEEDVNIWTKLKEALYSYAMDTFSDITTMKVFLDGFSKWLLMREMELNVLLDIIERAASIELSVRCLIQAQDKGKAILEYMKSKFVPSVVKRQKEELQEELAATLKTFLMGLEALGRFLDALERLSVTSVHVFQEDNPVWLLPEEGALDTVQDIIIAAQGICPHLVEFKRDNAGFFSPKLQNVEVLAYQLDEYIKAVQMICGTMKKGPVSEFNVFKVMVEIDEQILEDDVQKMLDNINLLQELRQDEAFRMVFLFQEESCSSFMERFSESEPRMQQFLSELEDSAVQLDRMNMGARISSVAGSSVGAVGGVLSIIGLALIPVTAGVSLILTMTGVGLGITSGVNSAVTTATEIGVNRSQQKRASETFQKFKEDMKNIQECLDDITSPPQNSDSDPDSDSLDVAVAVGKVLGKAGTVGKGIDSLVDAASAAKLLRSEELLASAGKVVAEEGKALRNVPRVASELPDMGQAAARGPLALSRGARGVFIALNALFLGMDVFFIVNDSMNLARGSETEVSKFIRARSALWQSQMDSWKKIYKHLEKGQVSFQKKQAILKTEFYPDVDDRIKLKEALSSYATHTFSDIITMKVFLDGLPEWMPMRESEFNDLLNIKERAASIEVSVNRVIQSQNKGKAFLEYMKSKFVPSVVKRQKEELQEELAATLKTSLMGLEALGPFLDAVERLSVTSVHVFQEDNPVWLLPEVGALEAVQDIIIAAQGICPHLVEFKRDNAGFFSPKLQNVEVLAYQLDEYIKAVQMICGTMKKGPVSEFNFVKLMVDIDEQISEDDVQKMLDNINQLQELRQDEAFRMAFLFQEESCSSFMERFSESESRMQQFLSELEDSAVQLDRMNMGARISSVAGSSVGAVGGVLSIIGLALIPVTAGVSLILTMTGVGLGITSGVNSVVTTATEIGVNRSQQKRANETFQKFKEDVKNIQECLDDITSSPQNSDSVDVAVAIGKVLGKAGAVGKGIDSLVDAASAVKLLRSEAIAASVGKVVAEEGKALRNVPRVASELPDMGQAAARGPLALSRGARGGFIALNALFLGMDVFFIVNDSMNLARGSETEVSKFIRARSALWQSQMDSWKKIYKHLVKGQGSFQKKQATLKTEFYPDVEITREKEIISEKETLTETENKECPTVEVLQ